MSTIVHSDRASQTGFKGFTRRLQQAGIAASMGGVGTAYDNTAAESLFATIKRELVHRHRLPIFEFIEVFYTTPAAKVDRDDGASRVRKEGARTAGGGYRCLPEPVHESGSRPRGGNDGRADMVR